MRKLFEKIRVGPSTAYLLTAVAIVGILAVHERSIDRRFGETTCTANQRVLESSLDTTEELRGYLELRLAGDRDKIAEGVGPLRATTMRLERIESDLRRARRDC